jgi:CHASE3 domain sensor protein
MDIKTTDIINIREDMGATPVETAQQEIQISLEELDNITADEQKLALWQQISDAIDAARAS